jgi:hypothetical protein
VGIFNALSNDTMYAVRDKISASGALMLTQPFSTVSVLDRNIITPT